MDQLQKGAIGAQIKVTAYEDGVNVDLALATEVLMYFTKPNRATVGPVAASVFTDDDGLVKARYTTPSTDFLDRVGIWEVQLNTTFLSGYSGRSTIGQFEVLRNVF